jgi:hypothetical protein
MMCFFENVDARLWWWWKCDSGECIELVWEHGWVTTLTGSVKCGLGDDNDVEFVGRSAVPNGSSERSGVVVGSSGGSDGASGAETKPGDPLRMVETRNRKLFYFNFDLILNYT